MCRHKCGHKCSKPPISPRPCPPTWIPRVQPPTSSLPKAAGFALCAPPQQRLDLGWRRLYLRSSWWPLQGPSGTVAVPRNRCRSGCGSRQGRGSSNRPTVNPACDFQHLRRHLRQQLHDSCMKSCRKLHQKFCQKLRHLSAENCTRITAPDSAPETVPPTA